MNGFHFIRFQRKRMDRLRSGKIDQLFVRINGKALNRTSTGEIAERRSTSFVQAKILHRLDRKEIKCGTRTRNSFELARRRLA